jgi:uncharacterized repeat protein (TIGR01451 family)
MNKKLYAVGASLATVAVLLPLNGSPLLAQVLNASNAVVQKTIAQKTIAPKSQVNLVLSAEREIPASGKTPQKWQTLDAKAAAVAPGNLLRYTLKANNIGMQAVNQLVMTQAIPQRTVLVPNSVKVLNNVSAIVTYSIDNGKTYSTNPTVQVNGKPQPAPIDRYTHVQIKPQPALNSKATIAAQYQVRVK